MNYEKKYKDALEKASKLKVQNPFDTVGQMVEHIFPELKESEDERMLREIKRYIKEQGDKPTGLPNGTVPVSDMLTWLEKQGEEEYALKSFRDKDVHKFMQYIEKQAKAYEFNLPNRSYDIYAFAKDILHWLEKQESYYTFEIKEGHWYKCVCDYMLNGSDLMFKNDSLYYCRRNWRLTGEIDERNVKDIGVNGYKSFFRPATNQEIKDWLEKQGEKKPTDKVEPKFKVGNWYQCTKDFFGKGVTFDKNTAYYCTKEGCLQNEYGCHIAIVKDLYDNFKLWTIQDAKDGDVLVSKDVRPFIFTGEFDVQDDNPTAYCGINSNDKFITGKGSHWTFKDGIKPATKNQRDTLFAKMKEAGYEWDADKKELKKTEVASKESEDEKTRKALISILKSDFEKETTIFGISVEKIITWLEKQTNKN